jgi:AraC family transcriptional regulator
MLNSTSADRIDAIAALLATATGALDTDQRAARRCIERAATLMEIDLLSKGEANSEYACLPGGLAAWQAKNLAAYIDDRLDSRIRIPDLACFVQLSASHFFRAFRKTFGEPPKEYIRGRRIRRAQELMLTSRLPLSQVALECGMCDQAHLCRTFRRFVGINPNAWRRQFSVGPAPDGLAATGYESDGAMSPATGVKQLSRAPSSERRARISPCREARAWGTCERYGRPSDR